MDATTTFRTLVTPAPSLPYDLLKKRADVTCGDLQGAYPNIQAPICAGLTSICTFSNANQGCCDNKGSCQFYTTCNGYFAASTCSDSQCLSCPQSAPYCIKYYFLDGQSQAGYDGYSCNVFQDFETVWGSASSTGGILGTSSMSRTGSAGHSSSVATATSTGLTSTNTTTPHSSSTSHTGAIVGGTVGGVGAIVLLAGAFFLYRRFFRGGYRYQQHSLIQNTGPEVQQHYGDGDDDLVTSHLRNTSS